MVKIINGRTLADELNRKLFTLAQDLEGNAGIKPGLAAIRVGDDPASQLYVRLKGIQAQELGFNFEEHILPSWTPGESLKDKIHELNQANHIHGIILQLPLPSHFNQFEYLSLINPSKDVDGLHPLNAGKLFQGLPHRFAPSTPLGCIKLAQTIHPNMEGLQVGVIGCSILVGRPLAFLMLQQNSTVFMAHKKTQNLPEICLSADILFIAIGNPQFIKGEWIKKGATVIDIGINRLASGKIVGDVDFESAQLRAGAITPVPGGVGPMTIACLLQNTLEAAYQYANVSFPLL